ncbi:MAG: HlyC/CorC family transporter [Synechococcaceae cyanobacterium SM2_3_1]|nr:HlyC/CorC family transporter [Synechococcaceae cyanobacterium SM2_3_1]
MLSFVLEFLFILVLVLANGVFAMSETAVVSSRKARLQQQAEDGSAKAQQALDLANAPNQFLSTVQIGITLIGILSGALGGSTLSKRLSPLLQQIPGVAPFSEVLSFGLVVALITYLSLVLGELVPKRLALNNPEGIATAMAAPMQTLAKLTHPLVRLLSGSTDRVLRWTGQQKAVHSPVTEAEIQLLIEQATEAGTVEVQEQAMLERVLRLGDRRVGSLMTPRNKVSWLDLEETPPQIWHQVLESPYSRFPVCRGGLDQIAGVVQAKDLVGCDPDHCLQVLQSHLQLPLFLPETMKTLQVLETFRSSGIHLGIVVDEYATVQGLVTLTDILEAIVGDVPSANQPEPRQVIRREDGSWLVDGLLAVETLKELLAVEDLPLEDSENYQTVGGLVIAFLGHIPQPSEHFEWERFRFEVMDMDGSRVDKVLVSAASEVEMEHQPQDHPL